MRTVKLVFIDDNEVHVVPDLGASLSPVVSPPIAEDTYGLKAARDAGFQFELEDSWLRRVGSEWRNARVGKEKRSREVTEWINGVQDGYRVIYVDCNLGVYTDADFSYAIFAENFAIHPQIAGFREGLYVVDNLLKQETWTGLVVIASAGSHRLITNAVAKLWGQEVEWRAQRAVFVADNGVWGGGLDASRAFKSGVDRFLKLFSSDGLIRWWLDPPAQQSTWFPQNEYHNPTDKCNDHYDALDRRFGHSQMWREDKGQFAKALFEVTDTMCNAQAPETVRVNKTKANLAQALFSDAMQLEGLRGEDYVTLPLNPGLPFLFAAKAALDVAREEHDLLCGVSSGGRYILKKIGVDQFALSFRQSLDARGLVNQIHGNDDGNVVRAFRRALHAQVIITQDMRDKAGAFVLNGTSREVADVEWDASKKELRIVWPLQQQGNRNT